MVTLIVLLSITAQVRAQEDEANETVVFDPAIDEAGEDVEAELIEAVAGGGTNNTDDGNQDSAAGTDEVPTNSETTAGAEDDDSEEEGVDAGGGDDNATEGGTTTDEPTTKAVTPSPDPSAENDTQVDNDASQEETPATDSQETATTGGGIEGSSGNENNGSPQPASSSGDQNNNDSGNVSSGNVSNGSDVGGNESSGGLGGRAIAGVIFGVLLAVSVILGMVCTCQRKSKKGVWTSYSAENYENYDSGKSLSDMAHFEEGSMNPSNWRDLEENNLTVMSAREVTCWGGSPFSKPPKPVDGNITGVPNTMHWPRRDWFLGKDPSASMALSKGSESPWGPKRSMVPTKQGGKKSSKEYCSKEAKRLGQHVALDVPRSLPQDDGNQRSMVDCSHDPADEYQSSALLHMTRTLQSMKPRSKNLPTSGQGMHIAVVMDASNSFTPEQYDDIKSLIFNGTSGLFDLLNRTVDGALHCSFIQYGRSSCSTQPIRYTSLALGLSMDEMEQETGRGEHEREIHLGLNRCFNQLHRPGGAAKSDSLRRVVVLCGGDATENGRPSDGFAAWEAARALHADGVPVIGIDFREESKPIKIASGDPPLYFSLEGITDFVGVLGPLVNLLASVHLTPDTERTTFP